MSYIQNKLVEKFITENVANKYKEKTKTLFIQYYSLLSQNGNFEDIGKLDTIFKEIIEQSLTDYHNHTVEKWEHDIKLLKLIHKQELDSIALKSLEDFMEWSELRKSLQDTNPKE